MDGTQNTHNLPKISGPRLPYHPEIEKRFGVDRAGWKALVEAVFPAATATESVILALSYCKARNLDPFKKPVHIVPIYDDNKRCMVDTVWPGIGELRTTAFRTGLYAGKDATSFGPMKKKTWGDVTLEFPEWAQVTVYRLIGDQRVAFEGPRVYWLETFATKKGGIPNKMWQKRPTGQIDKCAEAAALRAAFPEELRDMTTEAESAEYQMQGGTINGDASVIEQRPERAAVPDSQAQQPAVFADLIDPWGEVHTTATTPLAWSGAACRMLEEASHDDRVAFFEHNADALDTLQKVRPDLAEEIAAFAPRKARPTEPQEPAMEPEPTPSPETATSEAGEPKSDLFEGEGTQAGPDWQKLIGQVDKIVDGEDLAVWLEKHAEEIELAKSLSGDSKGRNLIKFVNTAKQRCGL